MVLKLKNYNIKTIRIIDRAADWIALDCTGAPNRVASECTLPAVCEFVCKNSMCMYTSSEKMCFCDGNFIFFLVCVQSKHVCEHHLSGVRTLGP